MSNEPQEGKEITIEDIKSSLQEISEADWADAGWPIVSVVPRQIFSQYDQDESKRTRFWEYALDQNHFLSPETVLLKEPDNYFFFILHSSKDTKGLDTQFKAVTTAHTDLVDDPSHIINYRYHGGPCENRGGGTYPVCDFWSFHDQLTPEKQDQYQIPDTNWRKDFISKKILHKK